MTQTQPKSRTSLVVGILGAVVVGTLIAAILFGGNIGDTSGTTPLAEEFGAPQVEGQLPPMPNSVSVDDTATGFAAPTVVGTDFDNNEVVIENDGRPKAIVFLAHWCPHCQNEVPSVQRWLDETGGVDGVDMYSVATAITNSRGNYPPSSWLDDENWTVPVIRDDPGNTVLIAHGDGGFPYWVFTNSDGSVALRVAGEIPIGNLETILQGLN